MYTDDGDDDENGSLIFERYVGEGDSLGACDLLVYEFMREGFFSLVMLRMTGEVGDVDDKVSLFWIMEGTVVVGMEFDSENDGSNEVLGGSEAGLAACLSALPLPRKREEGAIEGNCTTPPPSSGGGIRPDSLTGGHWLLSGPVGTIAGDKDKELTCIATSPSLPPSSPLPVAFVAPHQVKDAIPPKNTIPKTKQSVILRQFQTQNFHIRLFFLRKFLVASISSLDALSWTLFLNVAEESLLPILLEPVVSPALSMR